LVRHKPDLLNEIPKAFGSFEAGMFLVERFGQI
jgi:hypothetical protein